MKIKKGQNSEKTTPVKTLLKKRLSLMSDLIEFCKRPIFILCGEALIFALHGWLTGTLLEYPTGLKEILNKENFFILVLFYQISISISLLKILISIHPNIKRHTLVHALFSTHQCLLLYLQFSFYSYVKYD
jgi:hypothetical protein